MVNHLLMIPLDFVKFFTDIFYFKIDSPSAQNTGSSWGQANFVQIYIVYFKIDSPGVRNTGSSWGQAKFLQIYIFHFKIDSPGVRNPGSHEDRAFEIRESGLPEFLGSQFKKLKCRYPPKFEKKNSRNDSRKPLIGSGPDVWGKNLSSKTHETVPLASLFHWLLL